MLFPHLVPVKSVQLTVAYTASCLTDVSVVDTRTQFPANGLAAGRSIKGFTCARRLLSLYVGRTCPIFTGIVSIRYIVGVAVTRVNGLLFTVVRLPYGTRRKLRPLGRL